MKNEVVYLRIQVDIHLSVHASGMEERKEIDYHRSILLWPSSQARTQAATRWLAPSLSFHPMLMRKMTRNRRSTSRNSTRFCHQV